MFLMSTREYFSASNSLAIWEGVKWSMADGAMTPRLSPIERRKSQRREHIVVRCFWCSFFYVLVISGGACSECRGAGGGGLGNPHHMISTLDQESSGLREVQYVTVDIRRSTRLSDSDAWSERVGAPVSPTALAHLAQKGVPMPNFKLTAADFYF